MKLDLEQIAIPDEEEARAAGLAGRLDAPISSIEPQPPERERRRWLTAAVTVGASAR